MVYVNGAQVGAARNERFLSGYGCA